MTKSKNKLSPRKVWLTGEDDLLLQYYPNTLSKDLAKAFGCTLSQIYNRAYTLNIAKSKAFIAQNALENINRPGHGARQSQFKLGQTPPNKGMKGICYAGSEVGHFPKGHKPANYCEVGSLRINSDGGLDIKLADGLREWYYLSHYNWFLAHGEWPGHGMCLRFLDGDIHNPDIENLQLITRKENMRLNSVHTNYPPEIARLVQLRGALNRHINNNTRNTRQQPAQGAPA